MLWHGKGKLHKMGSGLCVFLYVALNLVLMSFKTIGFLGMHWFDNSAAIRGAILVTDIDTKPLEFRVTAPVSPQTFQEILYGDILVEHISVELIGVPLINSVQQKPDIILARDNLFLGLNIKQEIPTILVLAEDEPFMKKGSSTQPLTSPNSSYPAIKIGTSGQYESSLLEIASELQAIFLSRDLMEPFDRIKKACSDVHTRKVGTK